MKTTNHILTTLLLVLTFSSYLNSQTTVTLNAVQDSRISIKPADVSVANTNYGDWQSISAYAWTTSGNPVQYRALFEFDLSSIPIASIIDEANLSLFYDPTSPQSPHESLTGSNACHLQRIISSWDESLVTWNTQPDLTIVNQVTIQESNSPTQDYPNIDVTQLVQDMVDTPANSHGFLLKLITEENYRKMIFASSDHQDSTLHPTLEITYTFATRTNEPGLNELDLKIYPNPFSKVALVSFDSEIKIQNFSIKVYNSVGRLIKQFENIVNEIEFERNDLPDGIYFLIAESEGKIIGTKKLIIN